MRNWKQRGIGQSAAKSRQNTLKKILWSDHSHVGKERFYVSDKERKDVALPVHKDWQGVSHKTYQRIKVRDIITPPKTPKSKCIITMPPFLTDELKKYTSHLYGIMADERILRIFRFTKFYIEYEIIRGIKASGVKRICLHDIRHSQVGETAEKITAGT